MNETICHVRHPSQPLAAWELSVDRGREGQHRIEKLRLCVACTQAAFWSERVVEMRPIVEAATREG